MVCQLSCGNVSEWLLLMFFSSEEDFGAEVFFLLVKRDGHWNKINVFDQTDKSNGCKMSKKTCVWSWIEMSLFLITSCSGLASCRPNDCCGGSIPTFSSPILIHPPHPQTAARAWVLRRIKLLEAVGAKHVAWWLKNLSVASSNPGPDRLWCVDQDTQEILNPRGALHTAEHSWSTHKE